MPFRTKPWAALCLGLAVTARASEPPVWYDDPLLRAQLDHAIVSFFGSARVPSVPLGTVPPAQRMADRFREVFDGVPLDQALAGNLDLLYAGCQPHNCAVAAAVVVQPDRRVVAAAVTHWRCGSPGSPADRPAAPGRPARVGGCDDLAYPTVTVFSGTTADAEAVAALESWARAHLAESATRPVFIRVEHLHLSP